jgi:hypothetical protein
MSSMTYIIEQRNNYAPYEKTVHVHNAPTDESIKIYKELKEKAEKSIIDSFVVSNTILSCHFVVYREMEFINAFSAHFKIVLNGENIVDTLKFQKSYNRDDTVKEVFDKISKIIAKKLFESITSESLNVFL